MQFAQISRSSVGATLLVLFGGGRALAQHLWTVDDDAPADFVLIQDAVNAAASGDVILVRPGLYTGFQVLSKGLAILGDAVAAPGVIGRIKVSTTSAGQTVVLSHLTQSHSGSGAANGLFVTYCAGAVRVQDCSFRGQDAPYLSTFNSGVRLEQSADVIISASTSSGGQGGLDEGGTTGYWWSRPYGGGHGAQLLTSRAALYQSSLTAGPPATSHTTFLLWGAEGGSGLQLDGSFVFASATAMTGGKGGSHSLSYHDCSFAGGAGDSGNGGSGLRLDGAASTAFVQIPNLIPGPGGTSNCFGYGNGFNGKPFIRQAPGSTAMRIVGAPRILSARAFVTGAPTADLTVTGVPGDLVYAVFETAAHFQYDAALKGVWSLSYPPQTAANPDAVIPTSGSVTFPITLPTLPALQDAQVYFVQTYVVDLSGQTFASTPRVVTLGH